MTEIILAQGLVLNFNKDQTETEATVAYLKNSPVQIRMIGVHLTRMELADGGGLVQGERIAKLKAEFLADGDVRQIDYSMSGTSLIYTKEDLDYDEFAALDSELDPEFEKQVLNRRFAAPLLNSPGELLTFGSIVGLRLSRDLTDVGYTGKLAVKLDLYGYDDF